MTSKDKVKLLCVKAMRDRGVEGEDYLERLKEELREIDGQNDFDYFLDLHERRLWYPDGNQTNSLVAWLLDIAPDFEINKPPEYVYGDFPDVDLDFLPVIQHYLKQDWAPKTFGAECVSNIGSYITYGIKQALKDMAKVHGENHQEIEAITTKIGLKDEEGEGITWEKALEMYPELKKYCEEHPEVADSAMRLYGRKKGMGKHAGGIIISNKIIEQFVPIVKDKDGLHLSAWTEGLADQDLGPMGFIKYDYLGILNLLKIALAARLIKDRYGVDSICALPGKDDWTDTSYLDDPKSLELANRADLRCIFQFDSDGIRRLVKSGGVDSFDDLVAYTALYRPGPMGEGMHDSYVKRKKGEEKYELHPLIEPILGKTYGIMVFQEQVMRIIHVVGGIPLKDCEIVRKAISKKKVKLFEKYKEIFVEVGQKNLGWTREQLEDFWSQIEAFAGYGFNASHATAYTYVSSRLLWLKAHYPLEFFAAILSCESDSEKIKGYMIEARNYGIEIRPPDYNLSKIEFNIVDPDGVPSHDSPIYFSLPAVKGIGFNAAERIVEHQPYEGLDDFIHKFGTDASVMKPLIGLRVFKEGDPISLYKYYEHFKDITKKRSDRQKRFQAGCMKKIKELRDMFHPDFPLKDVPDEEIDFNDKFITRLQDMIDSWNAEANIEDLIPFEKMDEEVEPLKKKYRRAVNTYEKKVEEDKPIKHLYDPSKCKVPDDILKIYPSIEESERSYYGFLWHHPLEKSPQYRGRTFEWLRNEEKATGYVQVRVLKVEKKTSKKGNIYYLIKAEDAHSEAQFIQVWQDDWERFGEDFVEGNMLTVKLDVPSGGFMRYTFNSPPKHKRYLLPKTKDADHRLFPMEPGKDEE